MQDPGCEMRGDPIYGANGPRCLVQFVGVAIPAMSSMSWSARYIEQGSVLRTLSHHLYSIYPWDRLPDQVVELLVDAPHITQLWLKNKLRLTDYLPTSKRASHLSATQRIRAISPAQTTRRVSPARKQSDRVCRQRLLRVLVLRTTIEFVKANNIHINTLGEMSIYTVSSIPNPHA